MSGGPISAATEAGAPATEIKKFIPKTKDEFYLSITKMMSQAKSASAEDDPIDLPSIHRVPERVRELKPSAYTPRMVSIGPLHRGFLKGMQEHKVRYMNRLLDRMAESEETRQLVADQTMRQCADAMLKCVPRARACYAERMEHKYSNFQFAEMMLVDGCFVLEFLFQWTVIDLHHDPIFINPLVEDNVKRDLMLLENQIPFFVLQDLFELTLQKKKKNDDEYSLVKLVLLYYRNIMNPESEITIDETTTTTDDYYHILGLLHKCYEPERLKDLMNYDMLEAKLAKRSATEIHRAGVHMEANTEQKYNLQVEFRSSCWLKTILSKILPSSSLCRCSCFLGNTTEKSSEDVEENGSNKLVNAAHKTSSWMCGLSQSCGRTCLKVPKLVLWDITEPFLRNLIAYEQCCPWTFGYITSYATLMDTLVDSKEDVELLQEAGVLENHLGASEDASVLFNNLCKEVLSGPIYFYKPWNNLDDYCKLSWPRNIASLRGTYFSNPWSFISLIAALILFALTILQTVYTLHSP